MAGFTRAIVSQSESAQIQWLCMLYLRALCFWKGQANLLAESGPLVRLTVRRGLRGSLHLLSSGSSSSSLCLFR